MVVFQHSAVSSTDANKNLNSRAVILAHSFPSFLFRAHLTPLGRKTNNNNSINYLGDAVGGGASFSGVALVNRLQERQEVVVAGLLFFLGRVGLAEFRLERLPVRPKQTTHVRCNNSAMVRG